MSDQDVEDAERLFRQTGAEVHAQGYLVWLEREGRLSIELRNVTRVCVVMYRWISGDRQSRPVTAAETANVLLGIPPDMTPAAAQDRSQVMRDAAADLFGLADFAKQRKRRDP